MLHIQDILEINLNNMGVIRLHDSLLQQPEMIDTIFDWLENNCDAEISEPTIFGEYADFYVVGEDIPKGSKRFWLEVIEIVPNVLAITIAS